MRLNTITNPHITSILSTAFLMEDVKSVWSLCSESDSATMLYSKIKEKINAVIILDAIRLE